MVKYGSDVDTTSSSEDSSASGGTLLNTVRLYDTHAVNASTKDRVWFIIRNAFVCSKYEKWLLEFLNFLNLLFS